MRYRLLIASLNEPALIAIFFDEYIRKMHSYWLKTIKIQLVKLMIPGP